MSLFKTAIPVDLTAFHDAMPRRSFVHKVEYNHDLGQVEITWETDLYKTPLSVPIDFPLNNLKHKNLPAMVKRTSSQAIAPPPPKPEPTVPVPVPEPVPQPDYIRNEEQFNAASCESLEFWGIDTQWLPLPKGATFTEGFMYRVVKSDKAVDNNAVQA